MLLLTPSSTALRARGSRRICGGLDEGKKKGRNIYLLMHIYLGEQDLKDENRALAITGRFQVDKEVEMPSGQLSQVRNSFNTSLEYIVKNHQFVLICYLNLIVPFWHASAAYQASFIEPLLVFWREVESKNPWRDQTSLICHQRLSNRYD